MSDTWQPTHTMARVPMVTFFFFFFFITTRSFTTRRAKADKSLRKVPASDQKPKRHRQTDSNSHFDDKFISSSKNPSFALSGHQKSGPLPFQNLQTLATNLHCALFVMISSKMRQKNGATAVTFWPLAPEPYKLERKTGSQKNRLAELVL